MSDRPVRLDVRAQADARANAQTSQSFNGGARERPSDEQLDRFRNALGRGSSEEKDDAPKESFESPFALFGLARAVTLALEPETLPPSDTASRASQLASEIADRILVSEDDPHEARITISDDVMSGVEVRIARAEGRWSVTFIVSDSDSLQLLERSAAGIATQLAQRLQSEVEVQVIDATRPGEEPICIVRAVPEVPEVEGNET